MSKHIEKTLVVIKPDGVQRGLIGNVISRFEQRGLKIVAMKMTHATAEHVDGHYPKDEKWLERLGDKAIKSFQELNIDLKEAIGTDDKKEVGKILRQWTLTYMTESPVVTMVVEGLHAIDMVRKIVGATFPRDAEIGTIRGDFSVDSPVLADVKMRSIKNIIHASETKEEAAKEVKHWFSEEEIYDWSRADHAVMF